MHEAAEQSSTLSAAGASPTGLGAHGGVIVNLTPGVLIDWEELFGNRNPVEIEIGTGKGGFLLRRARERPDRNLLGIEWAGEYCRLAADRLERWGVRNARLVRIDASYLVRRLCPRESVHAFHIYHPDPWPKRRHHKRRLFQPAFVDAAVACLVHGGRLAVQSDHAEYFAIIRSLLLGHPELVEVPFDDPQYGVTADQVGTNFEVKYRREGRAILRLAVVRR